MVFIGYVGFYNAKSSLQKEVFSGLSIAADSVVSTLEYFFVERKSDVVILKARNVVKTNLPILDRFKHDPSTLAYIEAKKALDSQMDIFQNTSKYIDVKLVNQDGKIIYVFNPKHERQMDKLIPDKDVLFQRIKTGIYIGDIHKDEILEYSYVLPMAGPVCDDTGKVIGIVYLELDATALNTVVKDIPNIRKSWEILLVYKSKNNKVIFLNPFTDVSQSIVNKTVTLGDREAQPAQKAVLGESGSGVSIDYRNKKVLSAWRPIPSSGFLGVVTKIDADEAFSEVERLKRLLNVIVLMVILVVTIIFLGVAKSISQPIEKLKKIAVKIGEGNLNIKAEVESKDEIGELCYSFNNMVESLKSLITKQKKSEEKLEDFAKNLEKKVSERTKDLAESQSATLNLLEDAQEAREKLGKSNLALETTKVDLENFSSRLEKKVQERTAELSVLYEVSKSISYALDYPTLLKIIMEALSNIINYDVCASLLFDAHTANIIIKPAYSGAVAFADEVKDSIIAAASILTDEDIREKHMNVVIIPVTDAVKPGVAPDKKKFDKLQSFFNVPFTARGKNVGMINVSSCRDNIFRQEDIKFISIIANQASSAIERLQTVITLEKSKMESIVESMSEGVLMIDEQDSIGVVNPRARIILGFNQNGEINDRVFKNKITSLGLESAFNECRDKQQTVTREFILDGEKRTMVRCDISLVKGVADKAIGIVAVLRDITQEKEMDKIKDDFVSTVSHELRTPLATMKEFTAIILDEIPGKLTEKQKEYTGIIKGNIDRLARLINNLLDISKIEAGKVELKKLQADIIGLANSVMSALKLEAQSKQIEFKTSFPDTAVNIYFDADKIVQVLTNLIGNAIKFTNERGKITVEVKDEEKEVIVSIADTGIGIAPENLGKMFGKFQQLDRIAGDGAKGTGLGLAISKDIIELHHGRIWVESKLGQGSKFIFTLPKYNQEDILRETVEERVTEAKKENKEFSLIITRLDDYPDLEKKLGKDKAQQVFLPALKAMEEFVRSEDFLTIRNEKDIVVFARASKQKVCGIGARLKRIIKDHIFSIDAQLEKGFSYGYATYPDDADNAEDLLRQARASCVREKEGRLKKKIMIVDDDPQLRTSLKRILLASGYSDFNEASDGEEAIEQIKTVIPDLLIVDLIMPRMAGYELIGRLKEDVATKDIPILIMSGYAVEIDKLGEYVKKKVIPVVVKPFNIEQVNKLVNYLL